ncbi:glycosyltransferase [Fusobacteria bacterium ZRK30]|nr:glycosyltransferase [Fusobacteria bacterium ZRK30]
MEKPLVSIIIPVYNVEKYIGKCLDSIVNSMYSNLEIIVINDCSPDNSEEIIKKYMVEDKRIVYLKNEKNLRVSETRNKGLDNANGKYVAFIDADDYISSNWIKDLVRSIEEKEADVIIGSAKQFEGEQVKDYIIRDLDREKWIDFKNVRMNKNGVIWNKLYKRELIEQNKFRFNKDIKIGEDLIFVYKVFSKSKRIFYNNLGHYFYRTENEKSLMSSATSLDKVKDIEKVYKELLLYSKTTGDINKEVLKKQARDIIFHYYWSYKKYQIDKSIIKKEFPGLFFIMYLKYLKKELKRPKITVMGYYGMENFGDDIFVEVISKEFREYGINLLLSSRDKKRSYEHLENVNIKTYQTGEKLLKILYFIKIILFSRGVFWCGGTIIDNSKTPKYREFKIAKLFRKKTGFIGVGVDSFDNTDKQKKYMKNFDLITLRDEKSFDTLNRYGIKNIYLTEDLSYILDFSKYVSDVKKNQIVVLLRDFFEDSYLESKTYEKYKENIVRTLKMLSKNYEVILVNTQNSKDIKLNKYILDEVEGVVLSKAENLKEKLAIIGESNIVLTSRLHGYLIGKILKKKVFGISYSPKLSRCFDMFEDKYSIKVDKIKNLSVKFKEFLSAENIEKTDERDKKIEKAKENISLMKKIV